MRTMLAGVTGLVLAAMLIGCGNGKPSSEDQRVAKGRWIQRVDGLCRKTNAAIETRGHPLNLLDLDRLVVRAINDARGGIRAIEREPVPEGAGPTPGAFVRELKALVPELDVLSDASEDLDPRALIRAADAIKPRLEALQTRAKAAGLRDCFGHDESVLIPDTVRAPVFAEQLARLERAQLRQISHINFAEAESAGQFAQAFQRYSRVLDDAVTGIAKLDPPLWAADQTANYQVALRGLQEVSKKFAERLAEDRGKSLAILDRRAYLRIQRELDKASLVEARARRKMLRAVGSEPTTPPSIGGGEPPEPESTEQS
jgi:hypothetical protein